MISQLFFRLFSALALIGGASSLGTSLIAREAGQPTSTEIKKAIKTENWKAVRRLLVLGAKKPTGLPSALQKRIEVESVSLRLLSAASVGDSIRVIRLLKQGANPNIAIELDDALSALGRAARGNKAEIVKILIAGGARVDEPIWYSMGNGWFEQSTALIWACRNNAVDAVQELLKGKANPNAQEIYHQEDGGTLSKGSSPITSSENSEILKMLLQAGANPNLSGADGFTALMKASARGSKDDVEILLSFGANPDLKNGTGKTAEDIAGNLGKHEIVTLLRSKKEKVH